MEGGDLSNQFLAGGVTNVLTLMLFYVIKCIEKKCNRAKETECTFCGSSCHNIYRDSTKRRQNNGNPGENEGEI